MTKLQSKVIFVFAQIKSKIIFYRQQRRLAELIFLIKTFNYFKSITHYMKYKICTNCGAENEASSSVCSNCGFILPGAIRSHKNKRINIETEIQSNPSYQITKKSNLIIAEYRPNPVIYKHLMKQSMAAVAISTPISVIFPLLNGGFSGLYGPFIIATVIILVFYLATVPLTYLKLKKDLWGYFAVRYLITQNSIVVFVFRNGKLVDYVTPISEISGVIISQKGLTKFGLANVIIQTKLFDRNPRKMQEKSIPDIDEAIAAEPENDEMKKKKLKIKSPVKSLRILGRQLKYLNLEDAQNAKRQIESLVVKASMKSKVET